MEAKDTMMNKESIEEVKYLEMRDSPEYYDLGLLEKRDAEDKAIANRQAEISFKAGIREVVEWLRGNMEWGDLYAGEWRPLLPTEEWKPNEGIIDFDKCQAKLKEWGVK